MRGATVLLEPTTALRMQYWEGTITRAYRCRQGNARVIWRFACHPYARSTLRWKGR